MKQKSYFIILILFLISLSCSKDENELIENNLNPKLNLSLSSKNSYSGKFNYDFSENIQEVKLIWSTDNNISLENKLGEKSITTNNSNITINDLKQSQTYYFKLTGRYNNQNFYSESVSLTTSDIKLLLDKEILNLGNTPIIDIIRKDNGYLIASEIIPMYGHDTAIRISKFDNDYNLNWTFVINEVPDSDALSGIISLDDNNYIGIAKKYYHHGSGIWGHEVYSFKFNDNGNLLSKTSISSKKMDSGNGPFWDFPVSFTNNKNQLKIIFSSDSTYYNSDKWYYREIELNNNGNLVSETNIGNDDLYFYQFYYDNLGNKYNYGKIDPTPNDGLSASDALLRKVDINNQYLWKKNYGENGTDDSADNILVDNGLVLIVGENGHQNGFDGQSRWIIQTDSEGNILWDIKETRDKFIYQGKDVIKDYDGNYLSLFFDIYFPNSHVYNLATLIKHDNKGNILWRYSDGEDFNTDHFQPSKVFNTGENEYVIFGVKEGKIWIKKIKVE